MRFSICVNSKIPILNLAAYRYYDMAPIIERVLAMFA